MLWANRISCIAGSDGADIRHGIGKGRECFRLRTIEKCFLLHEYEPMPARSYHLLFGNAWSGIERLKASDKFIESGKTETAVAVKLYTETKAHCQKGPSMLPFLRACFRLTLMVDSMPVFINVSFDVCFFSHQSNNYLNNEQPTSGKWISCTAW